MSGSVYKPRVAFQGEHGAFSEDAAVKLLGPDIELVPRKTFAALFSSLEEGLADYVLAPLPKGERERFEDAVARATEALRLWATSGIDAAMRRANLKPSSPGPASDPD